MCSSSAPVFITWIHRTGLDRFREMPQLFGTGRLLATACVAAFVAVGVRADVGLDVASGAAVTELSVGAARPMNPMLIGMNDVLGPIVNLTYDDTALVGAVDALNVGALRHPGGTVANYWSFADGGRYVAQCKNGSAPHLPNEPTGPALAGCCAFADRVNAWPAGTYSPSAFMRKGSVGSATTAPPVYDINLLTKTTNESIAELHVLKGSGISVQHIELGNEFYLTKHYAWRFPTPDAYIKAAVPVIAAARALFPGAKVAVVAHSDPQFESGWNGGLLAAIKQHLGGLDKIDAVTMHLYAPGADSIQRLNGNDKFSFVAAIADASLQQLADSVAAHFPASTKIWMTEFNLGISNPPLPQYKDGGLHGIFWASHVVSDLKRARRGAVAHTLVVVQLAAINTGRFDVMMMHALASQAGIGWDSNTGIIRVPAVDGANSGGVSVNGVGQIFAHVAHCARQATSMHTLSVLRGANLTIAVNGRHLPCVQAGMFSSKSHSRTDVVAINRCTFAVTAAVQLPYAGEAAQLVSYRADDVGGWQALPDGAQPLPWSGPLSSSSSSVSLKGGMLQVQLPALSVSIATSPST